MSEHQLVGVRDFPTPQPDQRNLLDSFGLALVIGASG